MAHALKYHQATYVYVQKDTVAQTVKWVSVNCFTASLWNIYHLCEICLIWLMIKYFSNAHDYIFWFLVLKCSNTVIWYLMIIWISLGHTVNIRILFLAPPHFSNWTPLYNCFKNLVTVLSEWIIASNQCLWIRYLVIS